MTTDRPDETDPPTTTSAVARREVVFFRRAYLARSMWVHPDHPARFEAVGALAASVDFQNIQSDESRRWWGSPSVRCTASAQCRVPRRCLAFYDAVSCGRVPEGIPGDHLLLHPERWMSSTDPVLRDGCVPAFLNDAMKPIEVELEGAVTRVVGLARWRCNLPGPVDLPTLGDLEWSMDGSCWKLDVRRPTMLVGGAGPDLVVNDARRADLEKLIADGRHEPLQQSLLREAESLRETNPRSALAIGVTAAEVAVKALVASLAPQTSWLVQNLPSPPIAKILEEYVLVLLPPGSAPFAPVLLKGLKEAVSLRNQLVHGARGGVDSERLSLAFQVLRDVVWLCDYFCGVPWAANRVNGDTLAAMNLAPSVDTHGWFID